MKRRGFYQFLFTTVTNTKRKFGAGLLHALFTRDFVSTHKWPLPGYIKKTKYTYILVLTPINIFISFSFSNKVSPDILDYRFVAFLRATLGKMAGTGIIDHEVINLDFWNSWPRRYILF